MMAERPHLLASLTTINNDEYERERDECSFNYSGVSLYSCFEDPQVTVQLSFEATQGRSIQPWPSQQLSATSFHGPFHRNGSNIKPGKTGAMQGADRILLLPHHQLKNKSNSFDHSQSRNRCCAAVFQLLTCSHLLFKVSPLVCSPTVLLSRMHQFNTLVY